YPTDTITAALQLIGGREVYGTGSPEGVVTAAVGTYYTDTAGTTGAWRWQKRTGAGNTGWVVVDGDTGWRNVSSLLVNGWTGSAYVKRTAEVLTLELEGVSGSAATATTVLTLPVGFRVVTRASRLLYHTTAPALKRFMLDAAGAVTLIGGVPEVSTVYGQNLTPPGTAWPTALPGTAA
ncbi:MAG TPA: hypothetical protein PL082_07690, partial [Tepidiformaceae bacterium]|nr:hypothetical protein [Tepidiformaceae bacterium]